MSDRHQKPDPNDEDPTISSLYHRTRREKPGPEVDAAILAASRRAVRSRPRPAGPFSGRWTVPASMAAILLISVILVPLLRQESGNIPETPASRPDPGPASAATASKDRESIEPVIEPGAEKLMRPRAAEVASPPAAAARSMRDMPIEATPQRRLQTSPAPALRYQAMPREESLADDSPPAGRQLEEIERLIETGETAQARAMLKTFVARYPEYPIAPEIRTLLEN